MSDIPTDRRTLIAAGVGLAAVLAATRTTAAPKLIAKPLPFDPKAVPGLSEKLLTSHHDNNYVGAVNRLGAISAEFATVDLATAPGYRLNGLKREELIAWNSMILHEVYFAGLVAAERPSAALSQALERDFGSVERWATEFTAIGKALGGGSGWVLLTWSRRDGRLVNTWAADHTMTLADGAPLLALDMYEHAYHLDFGAQAGAWVDAFMGNLNWEAVYQRYQHAVHGASEPFGAEQAEVSAAALLDVRRAGVFEAASQMLPAAQWRDPGQVGDWGPTLERDREVVVYCVYGHEVGRTTAMRLRALGLKARFLRGGFDGWQSAGLPLVDKAEQP